MAFDAGFTAAVLHEIATAAVGARVEKIFQPTKESVLFVLRCDRNAAEKPVTRRLLLDAGTANPRMGFLTAELDHPQTPPMLCMLLRKHLSGARLLSVTQLGFERAAEFAFECRDELGFLSVKYLYAEIMGKFSNLILCDGEKKVLAAVHTQDLSGNAKRPILPGVRYEAPPPQEGKRSPLDESEEAFLSDLRESGLTHAKFLLTRFSGLSPLIARELSEIAEGSDTALFAAFASLMHRIRASDFTPVLVRDTDGRPIEYSFVPITQYGNTAVSEVLPDFSTLIECFFSERSRSERLKQRAADLLRLLSNAGARLQKRLALQKEELLACADKETQKRMGDLITANLYQLRREMTEAPLIDYFDENCPTVTVTLDSRLTPAQNAQRYYKKYNKAKSAEGHLSEQIAVGERELAYLDTVFDALTRAETEADFSEIRAELYASGYASRMKNYKAPKPSAPKPIEYRTSGGWRVLCGKNNAQNDYITHKLASKGDLWFHIKEYPGSHVVLFCDGAEPEAADFTEAAILAAVNSKAPSGQRVTVDYTRVKHLKRPPGAKPGFVTFQTNYSAYVVPDPLLAERLRVKK